MLEFDENSTDNNLHLQEKIRKRMANINASPQSDIDGTYEANIKYAVSFSYHQSVIVSLTAISQARAISRLVVCCNVSDILIELTPVEQNAKILQIAFKNGERVMPINQQESSNISIEEMKKHINTFFEKEKIPN